MTKDTDQENGLGKVCTKCGEWKLLTEYPRQPRNKDGRRANCLVCERDRTKQWRQNNPEKSKKSAANWRIRNPIVAKDSAKKTREARKESNKAYQKKWTQENPSYFSEYRAKHKDERSEYNRQWRSENTDKVKEHAKRAYCRKKEDLKYRLSASVKATISKSITRGSKKGRKTFDILGYSVEDLKGHLELQFTEGMSWDNYGEWHIDHKIPVAVFNYETPYDFDFKRCWSLENLQPMWGDKNRSKGAKLSSDFQPSLAF